MKVDISCAQNKNTIHAIFQQKYKINNIVRVICWSHAEYAVRGVIIHPSLIGKLKVTAKISLGVVYCMNKKVGTKNFFNGANLETVQLINSEKGPPIFDNLHYF